MASGDKTGATCVTFTLAPERMPAMVMNVARTAVPEGPALPLAGLPAQLVPA